MVRVYLPQDSNLEPRRQAIERAVASVPFEIELSERIVQEEDWAESWKQFFQVQRVGRRIVIRPTWRRYHAQPGEIVLNLDPGMAFGTGQHPTTRLCLRALEDLAGRGCDLLDLGCGSGILSLAAAKLGCRHVLALDVEEIAVAATRSNARLNGVSSVVQTEQGSLGAAWPFDHEPLAIADLIVANISATVLVDLATNIAPALRPGGTFAGSGVVAERTDEVLLALASAGLRTERIDADAGWRAIIARRP